tara:strand:+ start:2535 stop:4199 length:1665 start_codon:yes stop_codon:yes gene_type:complete
MKAFWTLLGLVFLGTSVTAKWQTTTYTLKGGWNAINLSGDASHDSIGNVLPEFVEEVWRWNPNPDQVQFTASPLVPSAGTPEWSTWRRNGEGNTLSQLVGPGTYLLKCSGTAADNYSVDLKQSPRLPDSRWVRNGANLFGFPSSNAAGSYPTMSEYFATFPAAFAAGTKIYKYVGGDLGPGNPVQVFSPSFENLDRTQAYWFSAEVVGDFATPVQISLSSINGLDFGRTRSVITLRLRNRSDATVTVAIEPVDSEAAPVGQPAISGSVPLTLLNAEGTYEALSNPHNQVIAPQSTIELRFGIDRGSMGSDSAAYYASLLRLTDSGNLFDVSLPVQARVASLAGLWVGDALVTNVSSKVPASTGTSTPKAFPLRWLLHVDEAGTARLLSQAFMGSLASEGNPVGICTSESGLLESAKGSASRMVSAHMPLDTVVSTGTGAVAPSNTLMRTFTIPFNDPTNPLVHTYHPDHDNKNARPDGTVEHLADGQESYSITREVSFEFTTTPPEGISPVGWGSAVLGGNYSEVLKTQGYDFITTSGIFILQRASESGTIILD